MFHTTCHLCVQLMVCSLIAIGGLDTNKPSMSINEFHLSDQTLKPSPKKLGTDEKYVNMWEE